MRSFHGFLVPAPLLATLFLAPGGCNAKQEEHPVSAAEPSIERVAKFLEDHVAQALQGATNGRFPFEGDGKSLSLELERVHRERLSRVAPGRWFVCADFLGADGTRYDLDFWVESEGAELAVVETTLHKIAGEPLYQWVERDGTWSRRTLDGKPLDAAGEHPEQAEHPEEHPAEHPEHPK